MRLLLILGTLWVSVFGLSSALATDRDVLGDHVFILASDHEFAAGSCTLMDMGSPWTHQDNLLPLCPDAVARVYDDLVYVVGRAGCDNILVLDPQDGFSVVEQFSTGVGSNPQDICFVHSTRAFITRYDTSELWEVNPQTGEHTGTIDLSPLADADGLPEMKGMAVCENRLYVCLQRLDRDYYWTPVPPSYLAVIDLTTNTLIDSDDIAPGMQGIELLATNPYPLVAQDPLGDRFYVGETGSYGVLDGGVEAFDAATGQSLGFITTEAALGGDLYVWTSANLMTGYAVVLSPSWSTSVVAFDLSTGALLGTVISSDEYAYPHLAVDPSYKELYVADASYAYTGVRVFDSETLLPLSGSINIGLAPRWILPLHGPASGIDEGWVDGNGSDPHPERTGSAATALLEVWPQPAMESVNVAFSGIGRGPMDVSIWSAEGRHLRTLARGLSDPLRRVLSWDGRFAGGGRAPEGVYFVRVSSAHGSITRPIHLLR